MPNKIEVKRMWISPEQARKWLRTNLENNRHISEKRVDLYARDLENDEWKETGDTIKFSNTGKLIDGQHRLSAAIKADKGFYSLVVENLPEESFTMIDRNQPRTVAQILTLSSGIPSANNVAAAAGWLLRFRDGILIPRKSYTPTTIEIVNAVEKYKGLGDSVNYINSYRKNFKMGNTTVATVCHYLFTRQDATKAEKFFNGFLTGVNLSETDPIYRLREKIMSIVARANNLTVSTYELYALFFKAWNAYKENKKYDGKLHWFAGEAFPNIGSVTSFSKVRPEYIPVKPRMPKGASLEDLLQKQFSLDQQPKEAVK